MGMTNAEKQAAHRARMRSKGLVHIQAWVSPTQADAIRAILAGAATAAPLPFQKAKRSRRQKKLTPAEAAQLQITERNRTIIAKHFGEIERMEAERLSRTRIRHWLEERGADFGGKTTTLNAELGPRSFKKT
jgi:hypothetical protein